MKMQTKIYQSRIFKWFNI